MKEFIRPKIMMTTKKCKDEVHEYDRHSRFIEDMKNEYLWREANEKKTFEELKKLKPRPKNKYSNKYTYECVGFGFRANTIDNMVGFLKSRGAKKEQSTLKREMIEKFQERNIIHIQGFKIERMRRYE